MTLPSSFRNLNEWHDEFLLQASPHDPETFPIAIVGNKMDLVKERAVTAKKALKWCQEKNNLSHFEVSSLHGINVDLVFEALARRALAREKDMDEFVGQVVFGQEKTKKTGCGC